MQVAETNSAVALRPSPFQDCGLKYRTIPAPTAANMKPRYSSGFGAVFGGCSHIEKKTFTNGAPAKTRGMTYVGRPPDLKAKIMQTAPMAPNAPPATAAKEPLAL